ncbi:MAG: hypothetical protein A3J24_03300 [Deltaproteobacteria bacterium RIFCSPLOWO2_02_FULL_53_8]|nr:MAG: hypothetical protein A3J24_03300 [Deltaproteobacteria bacterium RIFCSPLOWO2_02_FULL_53_8]
MSKPPIDDGNCEVMRLNVYLTRNEYPELFNELKKFSKGIKRIQRLKTIANERLILAGRILPLKECTEDGAAISRKRVLGEEDEMAAAREAFGPSIK